MDQLMHQVSKLHMVYLLQHTLQHHYFSQLSYHLHFQLATPNNQHYHLDPQGVQDFQISSSQIFFPRVLNTEFQIQNSNNRMMHQNSTLYPVDQIKFFWSMFSQILQYQTSDPLILLKFHVV